MNKAERRAWRVIGVGSVIIVVVPILDIVVGEPVPVGAVIGLSALPLAIGGAMLRDAYDLWGRKRPEEPVRRPRHRPARKKRRISRK